MPVVIRLAHLSDTHLGYEAHRACTDEGHNQRGVDVVDSWLATCADIDALDPDLVIHSGDIIDRPQVPVRYLIALREGLTRLAAIRPDGTRRQVIVIAGNHDAPHHKHENAALDLFTGTPGLHVVTRELTRIAFTGPDAPDSLARVDVTAIPHDALLTLAQSDSWDQVAPTPGRVSILTTHGMVGGSSLYKRGIGREYALPARCLNGWDYVALGHWHRRGPVDADRRAWYAGSTENCGFGDVQDDGERRGWLEVQLDERPGALSSLDVRVRDVPIRPMRYLPTLDAAALDAETISATLIAQARTCAPGSVVAQVVTGVPREVWGLVDIAPARRAATDAGALHYQVIVRPGASREASVADASEVLLPDSALDQALADLPTERRTLAAAAAREHLAAVRDRALTVGRTGSTRTAVEEAS